MNNGLELIRNELQNTDGLTPRERVLCLSGLIRAIGELQVTDGKYGFMLSSECAPAITAAISLLKGCFGVTVELGSRPAQIRKSRCLEVAVYGAEAVNVLNETEIFGEIGISEALPKISGSKELGAYLRGLFLGAGNLCVPENEGTGFHLEIGIFSKPFAETLVTTLAEDGFSFKLIEKKTNVIYIKETEQIGEFCALLGAEQTALQIYLKKTEREMRGKVNRDNNCAVHNMDKTASAAAKQLKAIAVLESAGELERLGAPLRELAVLRKENPSATLDELAELLSDKPSKSGVNHRMRKLAELACEVEERTKEEK